MPFPLLFASTVVFGVAVWGAVAWQYIWPALRERPGPEGLQPILGLAFLVPGVVSAELPATFAQPVAYGDFMTAVLALIALSVPGIRAGTALTWVFNIFGTLDLLFAFYQGGIIALPDHPGLLGAGYFILGAYVPLLLVTHGLVFRILLRTKNVVLSRGTLRTV